MQVRKGQGMLLKTEDWFVVIVSIMHWIFFFFKFNLQLSKLDYLFYTN